MIIKNILNQINKTILALSEPRNSISALEKEPFESVVRHYIHMLLLVGIASGTFHFLYSLLRAIYLDIFFTIDVQYWRMINYATGRASSLLFLYIFAGTFILFFASLILKLFIKKLRLIEFLKVIMFSMSPLLLFGWFFSPLPFLLWSVFLFVTGIKHYNPTIIKKKSILNRN